MPKREVSIILKAQDEASKVFANVANRTLPDLAKRLAQFATSFASVATVEEIFRRSITAALDAEKATAGLAAALRAQSAAAIDALPALKAHAQALSRIALADDEAIQGAQKILVSVGGLLGPALDRATQAALDLSAGLGIDLDQAATMVAKAAQGSVREFTRLGFEFQKNATDAQKLEGVLAGVQQRFGGMAEAATKTGAGQIHELSEAFGELLETLGTKMIGGTARVSAFTKALQDLNDEANMPRTQGYWTSLRQLLLGVPGLGGEAIVVSGFSTVAADVAKASAEMKQLAENAAQDRLENPMLGFSDAAQAAQAALKASAAYTAELAQRAEDAAKAAAKYAEQISKINENTATQVFGPQSKQPKPSITGASSDFVIGQGIASSAADMTAAEGINAQVDAAIALSKAVKTVEEAWKLVESVEQAISDATPEQRKNLEAMATALLRTAKIAETHAENMKVLQDAATQAATQLGATMVSAAFGAKVSWGEAFKQILEGFVQAIVQALILRAVAAIVASLSGGGVVSGGAGPHVAASGGMVTPAYAALGMMAPRGTDTVPAMLTPGEIVLPRGVSQSILNGRASVVPAGGGGRSTLVNVNLGGATLTRLLIKNAQSVVEVQEYIDARRG